MHILINGYFWAQPSVGSGQYLHGLIRWLPQVAPQHRYTLLVPATGGRGPTPPPGVSMLVLRTPFDGYNSNLAKLWFEQVSVPHIARLCHPGTERLTFPETNIVLHVPYFAAPLRSTVPVVTTVGDIIPLLLPEYRGRFHVQAYMALVARAAQRAKHIITFSQHSRWDIVTCLGIPAQRITATLLAADERYRPQDRALAALQVAERYGLKEPFIYYVGGLDARKNIEVLVRACARLRQHAPVLSSAPPEQRAEQPATGPFTLAIAGRALGGDRRLFPDLDGLIAELGVSDIVRRIHVPHEDGPLLYQACTMFAFPSRYEGFGLPPLEAMACGAPVVASNASSLPEVVGDAALCVPPDDEAGWVAALDCLLSDEALRADLRTRGRAQADRFSWRRVAEETVVVYEQFL